MMGSSTMGAVVGSPAIDTIGAPPTSIPAKARMVAKGVKKSIGKKNKKRVAAKKKVATKAHGKARSSAAKPRVAGKKKSAGKSGSTKRPAKK